MKRTMMSLASVFIFTMAMLLAAPALHAQWANNGTHIYNSNTGFVGIGTGPTTPLGLMHLVNGGFFYETNLNSASVWGFNYLKSRGTYAAKAIVQNGDSTGFFSFYGWDGTQYLQASAIRGQVDGTPGAGAMPGRIIFSTTPSASSALVERVRIDNAGNVGIGTSAPSTKLHVIGNAFVSGTLSGGSIAATYQDIAEWVPAKSDLEPGSVVILNPDTINEVMLSESPYDTRVAGVVSAQPGITLGEAGASKEQIATYGRVKVKVDATYAPVRIGDLLVTSSKPGVAMRSEPMNLGKGRKMHQPGTIIGKALEPLPAGEGAILVLLSMQ